MAQFQVNLIVTILDILSFASLTTNLYGLRIEFVENVLHDRDSAALLNFSSNQLDYPNNRCSTIVSISKAR